MRKKRLEEIVELIENEKINEILQFAIHWRFMRSLGMHMRSPQSIQKEVQVSEGVRFERSLGNLSF